MIIKLKTKMEMAQNLAVERRLKKNLEIVILELAEVVPLVLLFVPLVLLLLLLQ